MNRRPIFDIVRAMLGRGFKKSEIAKLDEACALAEAAPCDPAREQLGALSEAFESGDRGPGTVSSGAGDPGGVSYGVYQLSTKAGTLGKFLDAECQPWRDTFSALIPGTPAFTAIWKAIAAREPDAFRAAQHAFIERTHYRPLVAAVFAQTALDLDSRSHAVRDVTWSIAVQHAGARKILSTAIDAVDAKLKRDDSGYDAALIDATYSARTDYVLGLAANEKLPKAQRDQLRGIAQTRYPAERVRALAMLGGGIEPPIRSADRTFRRVSGAFSPSGRQFRC